MQRPKVTTILICVGLFLFFLFLRFPFQSLRGYIFGKIYAQSGILITAEDLSPSILGWPGVKLYKVNLTAPMGNGELELASEGMTVRAGLSGLFPPLPFVSVAMSQLKGGGDLWVELSQSSSWVVGSLQADKVGLPQFPLAALPEPLTGDLTLDGDFSYNRNELSKSTGEFSVEATKFKIPGMNLQGIVLPPLSIGNIKAKINIRNGVVEITNFQLGTPTSDLKGTLSGELRLGRDLYSSFLNLTLKLQLSDKYRQDPGSATLVSFLQSFQASAPGDYAMKWSANIIDMATNLVLAIPQRVGN